VTTSESARASDPLVAWLDDADIEHDRIGGKAASLTRLASQGFRIPPGFCLTTDAFAVQVAPADTVTFWQIAVGALLKVRTQTRVTGVPERSGTAAIIIIR